MKVLIIFWAILFSIVSFGKTYEHSEIYWAKNVRMKNVNICGDSNIRVLKKSLNQNFLIGEKEEGFFFSDLITPKLYWGVLQENSSAAAKTKINQALGKAQLWKVKSDFELVDLGVPTKIEIDFEHSIKDCVDRAKGRVEGAKCVGGLGMNTVECCKDTFKNPVVVWEKNDEKVKLSYSPNKNLLLKIKGEKGVRYCHSKDLLSIK